MKLLFIVSTIFYANFVLGADCRPQKYIDELDTRHYYDYWLREGDEAKKKAYLANLHKFRATNYGRISGVPETYPHNKKFVTSYLMNTTFLGLKVRLNKKIIPPLKCVEEEIKNKCQVDGNAYIPKVVSGYRGEPSYKTVISNHRFGIAIDFDPLNSHSHNDGNPCCGPSCKVQWRTHPICKGHDTDHNSPFNVAKVNPCWVEAFEKYGFHWLINWRMHDTMHFEYLGDPNFWLQQ